MVYQNSKPAPNDDLDVSVTDIQQNFLTANTVIDINHYPFDNLTASKGKHKFVEMPVLGAIPASVAGEATIYTKTAGGESQLFVTPDASTNEYQLTRFITASFSLFSTNTTYVVGPPSQEGGFTFLPGGMLFQYGKYTATGGSNLTGSGVITFPVAFSAAPYNVQITPIGNSGSGQTLQVSSATAPTNTTFNWVFTAGSSNSYAGFYWMAVGK